jgi:hypothetical protein
MFGQAHTLQQPQGFFARLLCRAIQHFNLSQGEVFGHAQVRKQLEVLKHHANAGAQLWQVGGGVAHRYTVHVDAALLKRLQTVGAFDQGGFARS